MKKIIITLVLLGVSNIALALDCKRFEKEMEGFRKANNRTAYLKAKRRVHTCHNGNKSKLPSKRYADQYKSNDNAEKAK